MALQITWFVLWGVLWTVYFVLDGFDLGVGMLQRFIARDEGERRAALSSIGPFWDGNEVWLVTAGGATFAAFPTAYALMFSYLYTALLLILFSLIIRGVAVELRGKEEAPAWRAGCDNALLIGSFLPALLFGVAFGNIFRGLPMDAAGFHGSVLTLLNPYGLLTGILFVLLFLFHGALWLAVKTSGKLGARSAAWARALWPPLAWVALCFLAATKPSTRLYANFYAAPGLLLVPILAVTALAGARRLLDKGAAFKAFLCSCAVIALVTATGFIGLFPNLIPSSLDPAFSLTIYNSCSSPYTLGVMTVVALVFIPVVIAYQLWSFYVFRKKLDPAEALKEEAY